MARNTPPIPARAPEMTKQRIRIRLTLIYAAKELRVIVEDDGKGFDPEAAMSKAGHWGFRGMRERARTIGGEFQVETAPGRGSTIQVSVPLKVKK